MIYSTGNDVFIDNQRLYNTVQMEMQNSNNFYEFAVHISYALKGKLSIKEIAQIIEAASNNNLKVSENINVCPKALQEAMDKSQYL
ncbi:hypothetical protein [Fructilactobacillus fructivorans]|uniref:Uncharacterized protein n=1 Tax=Fructilactobacillus fructivorans TaxID=1614 RepID=A0A0C1PK38_9LACO|nr:hypothetical protein [Fructilactobacillus fructivorans]KID41092.1 hypothetical protein LfDm3_1238 [Fructilactobacillus fructivorans]MCT0151463.1 hypothetical protein [Fructilactobacillus fructivorans]MCT2866982.1 hypothetical protein [Fructilactobacillus fructivorans]MCT2869283.1 hypothetical protein [Fructilactobacillus fructivorans]MCT2873680.1 hypothetical protein [Fructilactobacillus fructivorans]